MLFRSHHEIGRVEGEPAAAAHHGGPTWEQVAQSLGRSVGAVLLCEREEPVQDDDDHDRDAELREAGEERQDRTPATEVAAGDLITVDIALACTVEP